MPVKELRTYLFIYIYVGGFFYYLQEVSWDAAVFFF